jgi:predicted HicB family RNase H-like nuclease
VPNQPKTKLRNVRVPDDLWDAAKAEALRQGETVTEVIRRALRKYVGESPSAIR